MQTFLPYDSFQRSAKVLDQRRLGKQRVEVLQLLKTLRDGGGYSNHPAARMWRGHEYDLALYGVAVCQAWRRLGFKDTCLEKIELLGEDFPDDTSSPPWLGDECFHLSHRSNLVRKLPEHYRQFWPDVPDDMPYVWPA
jgi:hypothetical protein